MVRSRELRAVGIVLCAVALFVPQALGHQNDGPIGAVAVLRFAFPLVFYILVNLCIDEGRARERANREKIPPT